MKKRSVLSVKKILRQGLAITLSAFMLAGGLMPSTMSYVSAAPSVSDNDCEEEPLVGATEEDTINGIVPLQPQTKMIDDQVYYCISNVQELYWFAGLVNGDSVVCKDGIEKNPSANACLEQDIVVNEEIKLGDSARENYEWITIHTYRGTFDGQGHSISGLYIGSRALARCGLFTDLEGIVRRVSVIDSYFTVCDRTVTFACAGSIAAIVSDEGTVENCYSNAIFEIKSIANKDFYIGGIVGRSEVADDHKVISNCLYTGTGVINPSESSKEYFGGILGYGAGTHEEMDSNITFNFGAYFENNYYSDKCLASSFVGNYQSTYAVHPSSKRINYKVTDEQLQSGEVAFGLAKEDTDNPIWRQNLTADDTHIIDIYPVLNGSHRIVKKYIGKLCPDLEGTDEFFSDLDENPTLSKDHTCLSSGKCIYCGNYGDLAAAKPEFDEEKQAYLISTIPNLYWFADMVAGNTNVCGEGENQISLSAEDRKKSNAILMNDLVLNEKDAENPLVWDQSISEYKGCFDGNGHSIAGLYLDEDGSTGFFGSLNEGAIVKYLELLYPVSSKVYTVTGGAGLLASYISSAKVIGCSVVGGSLNGTYNYAGAIAAEASGEKTIIESCMVIDTSVTGTCINYNINYARFYGAVVGFFNSSVRAENINYNYTNSSINACCAYDMTPYNERFSKTQDIASGELAYYLNGEGKYSGEDRIWSQNIGEDARPILDKSHSEVFQYLGKRCPDDLSPEASYHNEKKAQDGDLTHVYDFYGLCKYCEKSHPNRIPELVDNYYQIENAMQLYWFAGLVNGDENVCRQEGETIYQKDLRANAQLVNDIVINDRDMTSLDDEALGELILWTPIANPVNSSNYSGVFDGDGHYISGLYADGERLFGTDTKGYVAFVGRMNLGTIKNLEIRNSYFSGRFYVGSFVAYFVSGTVNNCYSEAYLRGTSTNSYVGGMVGINAAYNCSIINSLFCGVCTLQNGGKMGGILGYANKGYSGSAYYSEVKNCYFSQELSGAIGYPYVETTSNILSISNEELQNGMITYGLSKGDIDKPVWRQDIGVDNRPVLNKSHSIVYKGYEKPCPLSTDYIWYEEYSNNPEVMQSSSTHTYKKDVCIYCHHIRDGIEIKRDADGTFCISSVAQLYYYAGYISPDSVCEIVCGEDALNTDYSLRCNTNARLASDICINEEAWSEDNTSLLYWNPIPKFQAQLDGEGHTLSGIYTLDGGFINQLGVDYRGLGPSYSQTVVENLTIDNSRFVSTTQMYFGALANRATLNVYVKNCDLTSSVIVDARTNGGGCCIAGFIGYFQSSNDPTPSVLDKLCSKAQIKINPDGTSSGYAGGIVGEVAASTIRFIDCINYSDIETSRVFHAGGIAGMCTYSPIELKSCVNYGTVHSSGIAGGMLGVLSTGSIDVTESNNYGNVISEVTNVSQSGVGGFIGSLSFQGECYIKHSTNEGEVKHINNASASVGVGGFVGTVYPSGSGGLTISECMNTGDIANDTSSGTNGTAGILGIHGGGSLSVYNCINAGSIHSNSYFAGGIIGNNYSLCIIYNVLNVGNVSAVNKNAPSGPLMAYSSDSSVDSTMAKNLYYLSSCFEEGYSYRYDVSGSEALSAEDLATGQYAFLLSGGEEGLTDGVWFQTIGEDTYPVLDSNHKRVYPVGTKDCPNADLVIAGYSNETDQIIVGEHNINVTKDAVEATCITEGCTAELTCTICEQVIEDSVLVPASGHTFTGEGMTSYVAPTCTENGYSGNGTCSVCGEVISADSAEEIPALGHRELLIEEVPATCTEKGKTAGKICERCDAVLEGLEDIEKLPHILEVTKEAVEASCTESGYTEEKTCTICLDVIEAAIEIPALGHHYVKSGSDVVATCTENGSSAREFCDRCGDVKSTGATILARGHNYVETKRIAPTTTSLGYVYSTCSNCGQRKVDTLPKLPSGDSNGDGGSGSGSGTNPGGNDAGSGSGSQPGSGDNGTNPGGNNPSDAGNTNPGAGDTNPGNTPSNPDSGETTPGGDTGDTAPGDTDEPDVPEEKPLEIPEGSYAIIYDGNGATSGVMDPTVVKVSKSVKLTANTYKRTGYTFNGWNTKANGKGKTYKNKASVKKLAKSGQTITLYAQWTANKYTVKFAANGGKGKMTSKTYAYGKSYKLPKNGFTRKGYKFNGWNTKKNGKGTAIKDKASVKNLTAKNKGTVTLYAQWKKNKK